jgi:hypothetical protein
MVCYCCGEEKKLIKAHIIPEGFFRHLRSGKGTIELHTNTESTYPKRASIGIYDKNILCGDCDQIFGPWENHAQKVLLHNFSEDLAIYDGHKKVGYKITDYDYNALKLFFISLLWRASISKQQFYKRVSTGPFENMLKDMILAADPGHPNTFAVTLAKFIDPNVPVMMDPHSESYDGVNYCRFYLSGFVVYIKVDNRPPPDFLSDFCLSDSGSIIVIPRDVNKSKDGVILKDILAKSVRK